MKKWESVPEEKIEKVRAKAKKEIAKIIPEMYVSLAGTEDGIIFEEAYNFLNEARYSESSKWNAFMMYQYGLIQGMKRKKANPEG